MDKKCGSERWRGDFWQPRDGCHRGMAGQRATGIAIFCLRARAGSGGPALAIKTCFLFQMIAFNNCRCYSMRFSTIEEAIALLSYFSDCSDLAILMALIFFSGAGSISICSLC